MEAELIALASASEEAGWLRDLLSEIPMWEKPMPPVLIHCDSTVTIGKCTIDIITENLDLLKENTVL
jgi:cysteine sulfinate desulfinase/cysteine desulfurase-like protein